MKPGLTEILSSAVKLLPEAVLVTELQSGQEKIIFVNQAFEDLTGYSMDELRGQNLTARNPEPGALGHLLASSGSEGPVREGVLRRKDGTEFRDRITVRKCHIGKKLYSVQVHADVTQQWEVENRFLLAQKREANSHLISGLAHDFNNLLTAILVYSGLMTSKLKDNPQVERYVSEIRGAAEQGAQVVAELMNLGRGEAAEPELVDLGDLVAQTSDLLKRVLGEDIRLVIQTQPPLHKVKVHAGRIQQVLLNLGINAKDAMSDGGDFFIRLANQDAAPAKADQPAQGSFLLIEVTDSGTGMDGETSANIFKPFFSTKGKGKGTGLGLFTARTIVEHYGGSIGVESEPGKGTTFKVLLPAVLSESQPAATKATLLLVESEEVVRQALNAMLSLRGYKVLPAANSNQALQVARSYAGEIALLLANLGIPGASGPKLAREILKLRPEIKLLFMCEKNSRSQPPRGTGGDHVRKPFTPSALVHRIEEVLNRPARQ